MICKSCPDRLTAGSHREVLSQPIRLLEAFREQIRKPVTLLESESTAGSCRSHRREVLEQSLDTLLARGALIRLDEDRATG